MTKTVQEIVAEMRKEVAHIDADRAPYPELAYRTDSWIIDAWADELEAASKQQEPATQVANDYNADGKSCRITEYLPAGTALYIEPPIAQPCPHVVTSREGTSHCALAEKAHDDSRRIDWLADPDNHIGNVQLPTECVVANVDSLRAAIDAAMLLQAAAPSPETAQ